MILAPAKRELALQEQLVARNQALGDRGFDRLAHPGLVVMPPLIRRVDAAKAGLQGQLDKPRGPLFLPRSAVQELSHV